MTPTMPYQSAGPVLALAVGTVTPLALTLGPPGEGEKRGHFRKAAIAAMGYAPKFKFYFYLLRGHREQHTVLLRVGLVVQGPRRQQADLRSKAVVESATPHTLQPILQRHPQIQCLLLDPAVAVLQISAPQRLDSHPALQA